MEECRFDEDAEKEVTRLFEDGKELSKKMAHLASNPIMDLIGIIQNPMKITTSELNEWFKSLHRFDHELYKKKYNDLMLKVISFVKRNMIDDGK